jgi:rubredoxin
MTDLNTQTALDAALPPCPECGRSDAARAYPAGGHFCRVCGVWYDRAAPAGGEGVPAPTEADLSVDLAARACELVRERDAARAEAERLRQALESMRTACRGCVGTGRVARETYPGTEPCPICAPARAALADRTP